MKGAAQQPVCVSRRVFVLGHVRFVIADQGRDGVTFGVRPDLGPDAGPDLFSGHCVPGMAQAARDLAEHLSALEEAGRVADVMGGGQ